MNSISMKFENRLAFSNGNDELVLKNPPPFVPSCLITTCEATGPCAIVCVPPDSVCAVV